MLRNTLTGLALLIALLQFPGLPHDIVRWLSLFAGLAIVFLLFTSRGGAFSSVRDAGETGESND